MFKILSSHIFVSFRGSESLSAGGGRALRGLRSPGSALAAAAEGAQPPDLGGGAILMPSWADDLGVGVGV